MIHDYLIYLNKNTSLSDKEKEDKLITAKTILNNLSPFIWFIILQSLNSKEHSFIYKLLLDNAIIYLEKIKIADYLSLMLIELLANAENTKIKKFIKKNYRNDNLTQIISNKNIREEIYKILKDKGDSIHLSWKLCSKDGYMGQDNKLKINILNKGYNFREVKNEITEKMQKNAKGKTLIDFFNETPEENLTKEFGFYYFTFLADACKELNIRFDSYVNKILGDEFPIITLAFNIK